MCHGKSVQERPTPGEATLYIDQPRLLCASPSQQNINGSSRHRGNASFAYTPYICDMAWEKGTFMHPALKSIFADHATYTRPTLGGTVLIWLPVLLPGVGVWYCMHHPGTFPISIRIVCQENSSYHSFMLFTTVPIIHQFKLKR